MKHIVLFVLLAGAAATAYAQTPVPTTGQPDSAVRIVAPQYSIELPDRRYHLFPGDFDMYRGTYWLSSGDEVVLTQRGQKIFASMNGRAEQELVAAARNVFVAKDRNLKMSLFADPEREDVKGEVFIRTARSLADGSFEWKVVRLVAAR